MVNLDISVEVSESFVEWMYQNNLREEVREVKYFNHFCKLLANHRPVELSDLDNYRDNFLPFKRKNSKAVNSIQLCNIVFDNDVIATEMYETLMKSKNPYTNHGGKFSINSDKCVIYADLDEETKATQLAENREKIRVGVANGAPNSTSIEYWINQGYSEVEAGVKLRDRQATNSVRNIMKREECTLDEACFIRSNITGKWVGTMDGKSDEEKRRISKLKVTGTGRISKPEKEIKALLGLSDDNTQFMIPTSPLRYVYDFNVGNKVVEFHGDYWHCNPSKYDSTFFNKSTGLTAQEKWDKDAIKINEAERLGYEVMIIWEQDYKNDKDDTVSKIKEFLIG
jgi:G:T-mismatch repair DNA endonuclease (very short patch repair protein)